MRNLWKPSKSFIGKYPCIELVTVCRGLETIEYGLAGPGGEIWEEGAGRYAAVVLIDSRGYRRGGEKRIRFGADKLESLVEKLKIPADPKDQTPHANGFGR